MTALLEALPQPVDTVLTVPYRLKSVHGYWAAAADQQKAAALARGHGLITRQGANAQAVHLYGTRAACQAAHAEWQRWEDERDS